MLVDLVWSSSIYLRRSRVASALSMASLRLFRIHSLSYSLAALLGSGLRLRLYFLFRFPMVIVVAYWILQHTVFEVRCEHIVCSRLHSEYCEYSYPTLAC